MEVVITSGPDEAADVVAGIVTRALTSSTTPVLGLATGSSPLGVYERLVAAQRAGVITFAHAHAVLLDEYVGLAPDHPAGYRTFIRQHLVDLVDLPLDQLHGPDAWGGDLAAASRDYEARLLELGGVDLQLLGIGRDGHIGFNEPGSSLQSRTRVKTLTTATRADNARFFGPADEVPCHVLTQGLGTILDARHAVLIACGAAKAAPIAAALEGPLSASCPASILQWHRHATVVVDEVAASELGHRDEYRDALGAKPEWQTL